MPVTIPAGTKFEAIKPTTNVNRRSALVNAQDLTYTIEDIAAAAGGGGFTITNNYIPKGNASGSIVDSNLYQDDQGYGTGLFGNYSGGLSFTYNNSANLLNVLDDNFGFANALLGDVFGANGPSWGISILSNSSNAIFSVSLYGNNVLSFLPNTGSYNFGGITTKFGIINADDPQSSISVSSDLVTNISGIDYIKVDINGSLYKIELIP